MSILIRPTVSQEKIIAAASALDGLRPSAWVRALAIKEARSKLRETARARKEDNNGLESLGLYAILQTEEKAK